MTKTTLMNMKLIITEDYDEMSLAAAEIMADEIKRKPNGVFGYATGSSPVGLYKRLIEMNSAGELDFSGITTFNLDEYYPIEKSNEQSYDYFMNDNLFGHVNVNKSNVNIPNGEAANADAECARYDALIAAAGGIDMQLLGIGVNGHIGFNEPADHFLGGTSVVDLTSSTIEANKRFFADKADVPRRALTMGVRTIMLARKILMVINGANKADAVKKLVFGEISPSLPASVLQLHPDVTIVLDRDAAKDIKDNIKY